MATITLNPIADVKIIQTIPTTNFGTDADGLDVGEWKGGSGDVRRSLLKFDLSSLPSTSVISSATLRMYDIGTDLASNTRTMYANRSKRPWVETEATWNQYSSGNNWATAGGGTNAADVDFTAFGNVSMPATEVAGYVEISLNASMVQDWFDGTFANNGLMLSMGTEVDDLHRFTSRENTSNKPQLVLVYTYSNIKSVSGVSLDNIKKVGGVSLANIKKIAGVT